MTLLDSLEKLFRDLLPVQDTVPPKMLKRFHSKGEIFSSKYLYKQNFLI